MKVDGMKLQGKLGFSRGSDYGLMESGLMGCHECQDVRTILLYSIKHHSSCDTWHSIA